MRAPRLTDLDRALMAVWALVALPVIVLNGWLEGMLLPPIWTGSALPLDWIFEGALLLLVYGLPVVIVGRIALRALR